MENNKEFAKLSDILIERQFALGLSTKDIAKELKVSESAVGHWQTGKHEPPAAKRPRLAKLLQITVAELNGEVPLSAETLAVNKMDVPDLLDKLEAAQEANEKAIQALRKALPKTVVKKREAIKKKKAKAKKKTSKNRKAKKK